VKHSWVAIDVDCIPISKALTGQLTLDICYEIKENFGSQVNKKTKTNMYQLMA
jgi:hypothetical protein